MTDVRALINELAAQEAALAAAQFLAPCAPGVRVRVRVSGLVYFFRTLPRGYEGWGVFRPRDAKTAELMHAAGLVQIEAYQRLLRPVRLLLAARLRGRTWLAYPAQPSQPDALRAPVTVRLVGEGRHFDQIVARTDGALHWYEDLDRRADPRPAEQLRLLLRQATPPGALRAKALTPSLRAAYARAARRAPEFAAERQRHAEQARLRDALAFAGGTLADYEERDDHWHVTWHTPSGEQHTSAVAKHDLTVLSAGICLSGQDTDFDLQSLVGVVEQQWE
ncbi:MAG TPA: hypothetical protein VF546_25455 [Pyrinomonadaceae bacterium]|jgi:hypothetical protein